MGKTEILHKIPNPYLAKYLVAELVFGRGDLNGYSKPVECVKSFKDTLMQALEDTNGTSSLSTNFYHKGKELNLNTNNNKFFRKWARKAKRL